MSRYASYLIKGTPQSSSFVQRTCLQTLARRILISGLISTRLDFLLPLAFAPHLTSAMDDRYELEDTKGRPQYSVQEEYGKYVADAYPGQRTDQTRDERTRVRVGDHH